MLQDSKTFSQPSLVQRCRDTLVRPYTVTGILFRRTYLTWKECTSPPITNGPLSLVCMPGVANCTR